MLPDRDIELAHPEAFDFAFGNLPRDKRAGFSRHLSGCRYCRSVVEEYGGIGPVIKNLPPHIEPPAGQSAPAQTAAWPLSLPLSLPPPCSRSASAGDGSPRPRPRP